VFLYEFLNYFPDSFYQARCQPSLRNNFYESENGNHIIDSVFNPIASSKRSMSLTLISLNVIKGVEINPIGFMFSFYLKTPRNIYYCFSINFNFNPFISFI